MKKLILLFVLFSAANLFSQTYHFDYYLNYKNEFNRGNEITESDDQFLINSKNQNFEMTFSKEGENKMIARILDLNMNVQHFFELKNVSFPLKSEDFIYVKSVKQKSTKEQFEEEFKRRFFSSKLIGENDGMYEYSINEYSNAKLKNATSEATVNLMKFDTDLSSFSLSKLFDYSEIHRKLEFKDHFIVKSATNKFDDVEVKMTLEAIEPQNFDLTIDPLKIKYK